VGKGIARRFLEEGARVATCSRSDFALSPAAEGLDVAEDRIFHMACDQRDLDQIDAFVVETVRRFGSLDILINNAGGSPTVKTAEVSPRFHKAVIENNLTGPMWFCLRAYHQMKEQDTGGSIVNISSQASSIGGSPTLVSYGAAKAGLNHLTKSLAKEWGPKIRVNCLSLGQVMTEALREHILPDDAEGQAKMFALVPLKRVGQPEEVGNACIFLCSAAGDYINGATVPIDGGLV
jgi:NAD(P)-dependent dehydrogenase (short-subunit alcohol dehydrogenase family)